MQRKLAIQVAALLALGGTAFPEQLLQQGGFELPPVTRRKTRAEGADLSKFLGDWTQFKDKPDADGGRLLLGLTNEISRTGRQSLFVKFDKLTKPQVRAVLSSKLVPVMPGRPYHVSIWGRVDRENPVTLDQRIPWLKLRVDWFTAPGEEPLEDEGEKPQASPAVVDVTPVSTDVDADDDDLPRQSAQTGEPVWRMQPLPGSKNRPALFKSGEWREFYVDVKSPPDAAFVKVTWTWETTPEEGETNGVMFFDDATIEGDPGPTEEAPAEDADDAEDEAQDAQPAAPPPAVPERVKSDGGLNVAPLTNEPAKGKK